ncbi:MAG: flagellar motor protein MotB [Alphaproteobacteria bacterium]
MNEEGGEHHSEIIVVHRHGDHEEGHHGGAWKIAFADFMTAMMTFFLVMWLINSTDDQTLAQVATYFNPIKLTDRESAKRGVHDADFGGSGNETVERERQNKKEGKAFSEPPNTPGERRFPEEELFANPYGTLSQLAEAAKTKPKNSPSGELKGDKPGGVRQGKKPGGVREEGHSGGVAFRDPFDPDFRRSPYDGPVEGGDAELKPDASGGFPKQPKPYKPAEKPVDQKQNAENQQANERQAEGQGPKKGVLGKGSEALENKEAETDAATPDEAAAEIAEKPQTQEIANEEKKTELANLETKTELHPEDKGTWPGKDKNAASKTVNNLETVKAKKSDKATENPKGGRKDKTAFAPDTPPKGEDKAAPKGNAKTEKEPLEKGKGDKRWKAIETETRVIKEAFLKALKESGLLSIPYISLEATKDGVLISMTDKMNFEMFAIASAEPRPEVVVVMEKLAKILAKQKGSIIIRGHTDSRPFRSKTYDNWRLSSARAHMTYFMLVRGGVYKSRVERIEGYADRSPKIPSNTRAAANRRIEILLRPPEV